MIAKRADVLPFWEAQKAKLGVYGPNSLVFYQKTPDDAGYAYRAKNPYTETVQPPDENKDNWEIDKTYAVPWKENGKYEADSRVYYFNGSRAYVYRPSVRYFGGSQPPNEEVDSDGIRTWQIEMNYRYGNYGYWFYEQPKPDCEVLIPVKKYGGYTGDKVTGMGATFPEERFFDAYYEDYNGQQYSFYDNILYYLEQTGKQSKDYSEINSVFQSNPYDTGTYIFYEDKLDSDNKPIHRQKGIHRAERFRRLYVENENANVYYKYAKSQYVHTSYSFFSDSYIKAHGFAIEMWPNISESDYELVPTSGLSIRGGFYASTPYTPIDPIPNFGIGVSWPFNEYNGTSFSGDMRDPNGDGYDGLDPSDPFYDASVKVRGVFWRYSTAFNNRNGTLYLFKTDYLTTYEPYPRFKTIRNPITGIDEVFPDGTGYTAKQEEPSYSVVTESIDSMEASYEQPAPYDQSSITRSEELGNVIDFSKYIRTATNTSIQSCGWRID